MLVLLAGVLVFGVAMATTFTVLPLRIVDVGGAVLVVGASAVVGAAAEIPLMHRSAWLARRYGSRAIVLLGGLMFAVALVLYGTVSSPWGLVAASAVRGGGYALVYVGLVVRVRDAFPPGQQARGQALLQTLLMGVGPVAGRVPGRARLHPPRRRRCSSASRPPPRCSARSPPRGRPSPERQEAAPRRGPPLVRQAVRVVRVVLAERVEQGLRSPCRPCRRRHPGRPERPSRACRR